MLNVLEGSKELMESRDLSMLGWPCGVMAIVSTDRRTGGRRTFYPEMEKMEDN